MDLDGTLIYGDMTLESMVFLLKKNFFYIFYFPIWILRGTSYLKHQVAKRIDFNPAHLPYHPEMLTFLREQKRAGRTLVLATASNIRIANRIARYLNLFDEVIGSDATHNYSGKHKLAILQQKFPRGFEYAGNAAVDLSVWQGADAIIIVNNHHRLAKKAQALNKPIQSFATHDFGLQNIFHLLRVNKWKINLWVFVPLIFTWAWTVQAWIHAFFVMMAFCLCQGANYIFNDFADLSLDRTHPQKKYRMLASGKIQISLAFAVMLITLVAGLGIGWWAGGRILSILSAYEIISILYSLYLKYHPWLRSGCILVFYVLRLLV